LGTDPEVRYTQANKAVTSFRIATTDKWERDGQKNESTEWHNIVCWGFTAEAAADQLRKGQLVSVSGKLQTREWEGKDGNKRFTTEIVANNVSRDIIDVYRAEHPRKDRDEEPEPSASEPSEPVGDDNESMPF
jgi:single-strand DNA-binding protein